MKFSEMPYQRLDREETEAAMHSLTQRQKEAPGGEEQFEIHREYYKLNDHIRTCRTLAIIRHDINTADEYYEKEQKFYDEVRPVLENLDNEYHKVLWESPYRSYLEEKIGSVAFKNMELDFKAMDEKLIPLMQEENALASRYSKLIASAEI